MAAEYPLSLKVVITGALAQSAISCPSHKISMKPGHDELSIVLANGASLDRDFILEIANDQVQSVGVSASAKETNIAMLTLLPPEVESTEKQRDVVLVIDCSGSMQGDSLALAKEGVLLALGSLQPNERFGIIGFGTSFLQFDNSLQPANRKNIDMTRRWVGNLDNLGGTDINGALELALRLQDGHAMDILLLTDGQDWQAGKSVPAAKTKGVRIFTMGIGSAVAEDSIRMMADETGGACELIAPTGDMSERIYRHFNRMRQPQMSNLTITWPSKPIWESRPDRACFAGDAYTVFAALPETSTNSITVTFEFAGHGAKEIIVPMPAESISADAIVRVAAKQRLASLPDESKQEWAVKYQLITSQTDYLITVERAENEKPIELPQLQVQPQMLPAGWGGTSTVLYSRRHYSVNAQATGTHDAVLFSASPDYSHLDVPCVMRSRPRGHRSIADNGYDKFINLLKSRASRKLFGSLPKDFSGLKGIPLPDKLGELLDLLLDSHTENEIVLAFYQALLEHDGKGQFDSKFKLKAEGIIGNSSPNVEIVEGIVKCLNELRNVQGFMSGVDRYDIPAFLRKQAD
jgi:Ca-activated chloride channel family protein